MAGENEEKEEEVKPVIPEDEDVDKPPEGYTAEEWQDLSPTEKEGILIGKEAEAEGEEDEQEIDEETLKEIVGEEEPEKKEKPEKKEVLRETPKEEVKVEPETPEVEPEKKGQEKAPEPTAIVSDEELLRFKPFVSEAEIKVEEVVPPEIQTKLDTLDTKYDAGEITLKEYNAQRDAVNRDIIRQQVRQMDRLRENRVWDKEQAYFFQNRPEYMGKDFKAKALLGAIKEAVATIGAEPKYQSAPGMELLLVADRAVKEAFGLNKPPEKKEAKADKKSEKKVEGKPPAKVPDNKTLTDIPSAQGNQTDSPYAALDKLHGQAYEDALEKLTPAQRDKYADGSRVGR